MTTHRPIIRRGTNPRIVEALAESGRPRKIDAVNKMTEGSVDVSVRDAVAIANHLSCNVTRLVLELYERRRRWLARRARRPINVSTQM